MRYRAVLSVFAVVGALCALSAGAAAAQAQYVVHSEVTPTVFRETDRSGQVLTINGGNMKCTQEGAGIASYLEKDIANITIAPSLPNCTFAGLKTTWNFNGCTEVTTPTSKTTGTFSIACPAGKQIDISIPAAPCHIYIPAQTPANPTVQISATEEGGYKSLILGDEVTGLTYTSTGSWCGTSGTNGQIHNSALVRGYKYKESPTKFLQQHSIAIAEIP